MLTAGDVMSSPPIACRADDTLDQAARLMWDNDCGSVIVTSADGQIVGMITDRDICMASFTCGRPIQQIPVTDAMAKQVYFCHSGAPVHWALLLMARHQVRRLPVVGAHNRPVGLISLNNLIRYCAWGDDRIRDELLDTMEQICRPRWLSSECEPLPAPTTRAEERRAREPPDSDRRLGHADCTR